jgi:hypothetical protein
MASFNIAAAYKTGDRSATFALGAAAAVNDTANFADLAAALLDPTKLGAASNASSAIYKFFADNAAAATAGDLRALLIQNGVNITVVQEATGDVDSGVAYAVAAGPVAQFVASAALTNGTLIRVALASTISA